MQQYPLLQTKLYIPPVRPELVSRLRLIQRLNASLHRRLILVSAPARFGKTTLVSEWVARCEGHEPKVRSAWLSLDKEDNDPTRFLAYLVAALQTIIPTTGEGVLSVLQSPQPPPPESILTALLNEITTIPDHFILVLDDYHVIDSRTVDKAGGLLLKGHDAINPMLIIIFSLGALMLYYMFYQTKLIPRWISVWGFVAILMHLSTAFLILFGLVSPDDSTTLMIINFPIFLQEMVMAVWLIVKGFNSAAFGCTLPMFLYFPHVPFEFVTGAWILVKGTNEASETQQSRLVLAEAR